MNQLSQSNLQFIRIDRGISQFNNDYYAALGLPINCSPIYIRHVYLSIARILHPDVYGFSLDEKEIATQYLAKLVNPAYNILMKDEERKAYQGIFKLLAKRLMQKSRNVPIHSDIACEFMMAPNDGAYERAVSAIAKKQYQSLPLILEYTAQISELNLVYILYKEGYQYGGSNLPPVLAPKSKSISYPAPSNIYAYPPPTPSSYEVPTKQDETDATVIQAANVEPRNDSKNSPKSSSGIGDRLKICEIYMSQGDWKSALRDLREILQVDPNNSRCHAMIGVVYKNINQPQMAKISLNLALKLNPREPLALKHIQDVSISSKGNPSESQTSKSDPKPKTATSKTPPIAPPPKRGWLSNLLGWADPNEPKK
ncbi:MAG: molecular chaperone DnaJ [Pseudanabaena sp.]|nr:MAG: molecular chaperone DnaJ [Pseudanabaena sp.]